MKKKKFLKLKELEEFFVSNTDVLGSWCGNVEGEPNETPTQDADDL